jgi:hypothetical protein
MPEDALQRKEKTKKGKDAGSKLRPEGLKPVSCKDENLAWSVG